MNLMKVQVWIAKIDNPDLLPKHQSIVLVKFLRPPRLARLYTTVASRLTASIYKDKSG